MWWVRGSDGKMVELVLGVIIVVSSIGMVFGVHDAARQKMSKIWKSECPLKAGSINPWLVKIWDVDYGLIMAHGSIIAHRIILSTCSPFIDADLRISQYLLVGQTDLEPNDSGKHCIQAKKVQKLFRHQKCTRQHVLYDQLWATKFVDLALWITEGHYETAGSFPILKIPNNRDTFMSAVRKMEAQPTKAACNLPVYSTRRRMDSYFPRDTKSPLLPYSEECLKVICKDAANNLNCRKSNSTVVAGSRLCAVPYWKKEARVFGDPNTNWYSGSPLVCNGIGYGISTFIISRSNNEPDVHVIMSFLEHMTWIANTIQKMESIPSEREYHADLKAGDTTSKRLRPAYDKDDYDDANERKSQGRASSGAAPNYRRPLSAKFFIFAVTCSYSLLS